MENQRRIKEKPEEPENPPEEPPHNPPEEPENPSVTEEDSPTVPQNPQSGSPKTYDPGIGLYLAAFGMSVLGLYAVNKKKED